MDWLNTILIIVVGAGVIINSLAISSLAKTLTNHIKASSK
jgi:TRAP-type uncharacterized transport system fused permease subunit